MTKKNVLIVGLLCSGNILAMDFFENYSGDNNSSWLDMVFSDTSSSGAESVADSHNTNSSTPEHAINQQPSASLGTWSPRPLLYGQQTTYETLPEHTPPIQAQAKPQTIIELHEIHGRLVGYIEGMGYFPVVFSPALHEATQIELNTYHEAIIAQVHRTYDPPFGSPIPANSTTKASTDDSLEKNSSEQDSNDTISNHSRVGHKRSRSSETSLSKQPQIQDPDPLDKHIATNFDAFIKCAFRNIGASKPKLNNGRWQIEITDIKGLADCTYQSMTRVRPAKKTADQIKTIKSYFSDWPKNAKELDKFTATIKSTTKAGTNLSDRVIQLLAKFTALSENTAPMPEPSPKRRKTQ